jgi:arylsulfatase A-like enzyme
MADSGSRGTTWCFLKPWPIWSPKTKVALTTVSLPGPAAMPNGQPNMLILWGDDIGQSNLSCYSHGLMGYETPNIDRVAKEGAKFIHYYAEQSCTAGRAAFISGQSVYRTGLSKVGLPGSELGYRDEDPTIPELLKPLGYRTGQFGKNHFGDRDEHLPTKHGFDEFFGNLYHLNAEEEPEQRDYPKEDDPEFPNFRKRFAPRGVLHCWANADGSQRIENTGPLTRKRMETTDDEFLVEAKRFIRDAVDSGEPFFVWFNTTHMHFRTYARPQDIGRSGRWQSEYHDVMIYHDECIGELLDLVDELGISEDTIVMYSTDNGPHVNSWPDAGTTPFRSEKNTNWEGAFRVPALVRWPGHIPAGINLTGLVSHLDWLPTLLAAAGEPAIKDKLMQGHQVGNKNFHIHLDGYNQLDYWQGKTKQSPRREFFYFSDDGDLVGLRYDNWKFVFKEQREPGTLQVWAEPFTELRVPKIFNLLTDPYERADITSNTYWDWLLDHAFLLVPAQSYVAEFLQTFQAYPPRQKAASFSLERVMEKLSANIANSH